MEVRHLRYFVAVAEEPARDALTALTALADRA